jgi:hypothetical protein
MPHWTDGRQGFSPGGFTRVLQHIWTNLSTQRQLHAFRVQAQGRWNLEAQSLGCFCIGTEIHSWYVQFTISYTILYTISCCVNRKQYSMHILHCIRYATWDSILWHVNNVVYVTRMFFIIITGGLQNDLCLSLMIKYVLLIAFPPCSTKITWLTPCIVQLHVPFTRVPYRHSPTLQPSIYIISRAVLCTDHLSYTLTAH